MKIFLKILPTALILLSLSSAAQGEPALPSLAQLVDSVKAAVVNVDVQKRLPDRHRQLLKRFRLAPPRGKKAPLTPRSGSGFVFDAQGLVLTNNHVVQQAMSIRVRFDDGRVFYGKVLGRDPLTDVAVLKLQGEFESLPTVSLGNSSKMHPGDWVVAIGNPFGLASSVSVGIVSALDRQIGTSRYDQFLQTDAAINPGNSGGPLFNLRGQVIGMNTAIIGGGSGIGFAVPSNLLKAILPQLIQEGRVTRGWLGVSIQDLNKTLAQALGAPVHTGALIADVNRGSPAAKAGLRAEDIIVSIDGDKVASSTNLMRLVALKTPKSVVNLATYRKGKKRQVHVKLGTRPDLEGLGAIDKRKGDEPETSRQRIGIAFRNVDPRMARTAGIAAKGALIVDVEPGSPADMAGLRRGVIVVEVNHKPIRGRDDLLRILKRAKPGNIILMRVHGPGTSSLVAVKVPSP